MRYDYEMCVAVMLEKAEDTRPAWSLPLLQNVRAETVASCLLKKMSQKRQKQKCAEDMKKHEAPAAVSEWPNLDIKQSLVNSERDCDRKMLKRWNVAKKGLLGKLLLRKWSCHEKDAKTRGDNNQQWTAETTAKLQSCRGQENQLSGSSCEMKPTL